MSYPTREDWVNDDFKKALRKARLIREVGLGQLPKPRLDWLLLTVLTLDLGLWVGLLAWWIWR